MQITLKTIILLFVGIFIALLVMGVLIGYQLISVKLQVILGITLTIAFLLTAVIISWYRRLYRKPLIFAATSSAFLLIMTGLGGFLASISPLYIIVEGFLETSFPDTQLPDPHFIIGISMLLIIIGTILFIVLFLFNYHSEKKSVELKPEEEKKKLKEKQIEELAEFNIQAVITELLKFKSVHLYLRKQAFPWREKLEEIKEVLKEKDIFLAQVDLQQGNTTSLKDFLQEILNQLNIKAQLNGDNIFKNFQALLEQYGGTHFLVLKHFDLVQRYIEFKDSHELFVTLRQLIMENKKVKLVLITIAYKPFTDLLPKENPLSIINNTTFHLR